MLDNSETITLHSWVLKCFCSSDLEPMRGSGSLAVQIGYVTCLISDRKTGPSLASWEYSSQKLSAWTRRHLLTGAGINDLGKKTKVS